MHNCFPPELSDVSHKLNGNCITGRTFSLMRCRSIHQTFLSSTHLRQRNEEENYGDVGQDATRTGFTSFLCEPTDEQHSNKWTLKSVAYFVLGLLISMGLF